MLKKISLAAGALLLLCASFFAVQALVPMGELGPRTVPRNEGVDALPGGSPVTLEKAPEALERTVLAAGIPRESSWQVDRDFDLHGLVMDSGLRPLAGASVDVYLTPSHRPAGAWSVPPPAPDRIASAITDAAGHYRVRLEEGRYFDLRASGPPGTVAFGAEWKQQCQAGEQVNFVLSPACSVGGRVLLDGVGVPDIEVVIGPETPYFMLPRNETARVRTDRHGHFLIEGLGQGRYTLFVESLEVVAPEPMTIDVVEGELLQDIPVERGQVIEGRVVDADRGAPLGSASVHMGDQRLRVPCGPDGRFRIEAVRTSPIPWNGASMQVLAEAPGYSPASAEVRVGTGPEPVKNLEIRLTAAATATGRVVDVHGRPCPQATVMAFKMRAEWKGAPRTIRCQGEVHPDGTFLVQGLEPGKEPGKEPGRDADATSFLLVSAPDLGTEIVPLKIESDASGEHRCGDITLMPSLPLRGRVVDSGGQPCPHVLVSVTRRLSNEALDLEIAPQELRKLEMYLGTLNLETDDLGRFRATGLTSGRLVVSARKAGQGSAPKVEVELERGLVAPPLELVLPLGETLAGQIVDDQGRGIPGAWIYLRGPERSLVVADSNGAFHAQGLTPGRYRVTVAMDKLRQQGRHYVEPLPTEIATGTRDARVALGAGQPVRCVLEGGEPENRRALRVTFTDRQTSRVFHRQANALGVIETVLPLGSTFHVHRVSRDAEAQILVAEGVDPAAGEIVLSLD